MKKITIIGAGAAGVFCAIKLKEQLKETEVIILEANDTPLKKLLATGNGRCNLSNKDLDPSNYDGEITPVIKNILKNFDDVKEFSEEGLLTKWMGNLLYPHSEQAKSVKDLLLERCKKLGVKIICDTKVMYVNHNDTYEIVTEDKTYYSDFVVMAMGTTASKLSTLINRKQVIGELLPVNDFKPTLTQMTTSPVLKALKGVRVKGHFTLTFKDKILSEEDGELLFTDYGVSGIAIMQLSRYFKEGVKLHVDMMSDYSEDELRSLFKNSPLVDPLTGLVNSKIKDYLSNKKDPIKALKHLELDVTGIRDYKTSQAMKGGVVVRSLDENLESKRHPGLFVIGEVLNVTGNCGGYNLHFAFASAKHVARAIERIINA